MASNCLCKLDNLRIQNNEINRELALGKLKTPRNIFHSRPGIPALFVKKSGNPKLIRMGDWGKSRQPPEARRSGVRAPSIRRFSGFFNENKAFLDLNFRFITILWREQAEKVELFRLDHDKFHNPFQSFISAAASLEKWNKQLSDNRLLIYFL